MCGIVSYFAKSGSALSQRDDCIQRARRLRHRGPDWSGVFADEHAREDLVHRKVESYVEECLSEAQAS